MSWLCGFSKKDDTDDVATKEALADPFLFPQTTAVTGPPTTSHGPAAAQTDANPPLTPSSSSKCGFKGRYPDPADHEYSHEEIRELIQLQTRMIDVLAERERERTHLLVQLELTGFYGRIPEMPSPAAVADDTDKIALAPQTKCPSCSLKSTVQSKDGIKTIELFYLFLSVFACEINLLINLFIN